MPTGTHQCSNTTAPHRTASESHPDRAHMQVLHKHHLATLIMPDTASTHDNCLSEELTAKPFASLEHPASPMLFRSSLRASIATAVAEEKRCR